MRLAARPSPLRYQSTEAIVRLPPGLAANRCHDPCCDPVLERLHDAVIATAVRGGARGMTMGSLVDALETEGFEVGHIELAVWELLRQGRLLPTGFVCRTIRKRDETGAAYETRAYELLLAAEPDQLELELEGRR